MESVLTAVSRAVDGRIDNFISSTLTSISGSIHSTVIAAATLYFVIYGISILRGTTGEPFMGIVIHGAKVSIVVALATNATLYNEWVSRLLVHDLPDGLAQAVAGERGGIEAFSLMFAKVHALAAAVWYNSSGVSEPIFAALCGMLLLVTGALYTGLGAVLLTIVKLFLAVVVAVGPIFIGLFLFRPTRNWFSGWLNQAVSLLVLYLLVMGIGALITNAILGILPEYKDYGFGALADLAMTTVVLMLFGAASIVYMPGFASGIVGGAALHFAAGARMARMTVSGTARQAVHAGRGTQLLAGDARRAMSAPARRARG